nr:MAG TPA: secreted effector protein PipB2 [Caudoviricetes sp.]
MTSIPMTTEYVDVKVKIGAIEYTNEELQIDSIKISNGCYDGSVFGIGNVYIKNASITMNYLDGISKGLNIEIFFQYQGAWISFGQFVVTETPVMSGDKLSVSLESTLAQYANTEIVFAEAKPNYNFDTIIKKIEEITGKVVVFKSELDSIGTEKSEFLSKSANFIKDAKTLMDPASGCKTGVSVKTALAGIAILFGGNVYEDTNNKIVIKQKTYSLNSDRYILPDYLDGNYKYSKEVYAIKTISLLFNKYVLGIYYRKETDPPGDDIWTQNYLDEDKVSNTLLASQSSMTGKTPYNYTVTCDWIGWTSDGFGYNLNEKPGGRASACLRQGDLMYHTCDMTFVGIDFGWNIAPGNLIKVKVPELENPIDVLCGEISYEWDGGFTTSISCNCNIESNGSYSTEVSTQASAAAAQEGRQTSLELNYANITLSNIEDSTIRGSIFKDGTIDGSKIKDSTITGSLIADSTIKGSNIEEGTITGSKIKAATITGALIVDGTIRGNHIMESSIDGSKIEDSAITESKISNSSITNSKIKDGEIENSKIKDATLTGAKIKDATIGFEKVDSSFIKDLTADKAYIENLKASIADIGYLTVDEANIKYATIASLEVVDGKIDDLKAITITTDNLSAKVADLGYLKADKADLKYANIELSNIDVANVGTFFANVGLIDRATIVNGHVTGFLDSVEVNANKITAGTLVADRILLKGSEKGVLYALNNLGELTSTTVDTLDGYILTDRTINADKIVASSITTNELDVDSIFADSAVVERIFAQDITATGIIRGATLVGASVSADRGTIGGFGIFDDCLTGFYDEDGYQYKVDLNTAKSITGKNGGVIAIEAGKYKISSPYNTEHEWYVTYDGYMYAEIGEIAGFTLKDQRLISNSEYTPENASATYYNKAEINSKFNQEEDFLSLTCTVNNTEINKAFFGFDGVRLESLNHGNDYYDKFMGLSTRSLAFGVNSGTPYNGSSVAFEIDSGYSKITSSGEFTIEPSCTINVPTTVKSLTIKNNGSKGKTVISNGLIGLDDAQGGTVRYFLDNAYGNLRIWDTAVGERLLISPASINFKPNGKTIFSVNKDNASENGYEIIGCEVTTSGNFTCKKYRDGRLVIEYRSKMGNVTSLTDISNKEGVYYKSRDGRTFPLAFVDTPMVITGIGVPDTSAPFVNVSFDGISKTGYSRCIFWATHSGATLPVNSVTSAIFIGRWF